jgi:transposase
MYRNAKHVWKSITMRGYLSRALRSRRKARSEDTEQTGSSRRTNLWQYASSLIQQGSRIELESDSRTV